MKRNLIDKFLDHSIFGIISRQLLGLSLALSISCSGFSQINDCSHVSLPVDLKQNDSKSVLLLIADDRSGSTTNTNQPARISEQQYRSLLQTFIEKGYTGQFAIRIIGNTPHSGFEEALMFEKTFQLKTVKKDEILSKKAKCSCENKRIEETNNSIINNNKQKIEEYLTRIIRPKAINYKPNGIDKTDVYTALRDVEMKMNIGTLFNKIVIVVFSDGIDSNKKNLRMNIQIPADLLLIGWASNTPVKDEREIHLESADDLVTWFKNLKL